MSWHSANTTLAGRSASRRMYQRYQARSPGMKRRTPWRANRRFGIVSASHYSKDVKVSAHRWTSVDMMCPWNDGRISTLGCSRQLAIQSAWGSCAGSPAGDHSQRESSCLSGHSRRCRTTCESCARQAGSISNAAARGSGTPSDPKRWRAWGSWRARSAGSPMSVRAHGDQMGRRGASGDPRRRYRFTGSRCRVRMRCDPQMWR
jgi:hypothetical protein